ncbi:hypothetical protein Q9299_05175 [Gemmobacter fulvus]|uniref:hypothetical protein n=1 Tax=Gemmobacter fulvus TaxID=2840474 RepID=UPI002796C678|nr:hypothetical protein [Gemmobacter fulvus]MDQ1847674.1 hypothetical protein [Gemmobacter fulvus]
MTRKPKTPAHKDTPETEGAENSILAVLPDQDETPEQAAAEDDTSAVPQDADLAETGIEDMPAEPQAAADASEIPEVAPEVDKPGAETPEAEALAAAGDVSLAPEAIEAVEPETQDPARPQAITRVQDFTIIVTCHREGGRRRAGRRWDHGETRLLASELRPEDLVMLQNDPQFTFRLG